MTAMEFSKSAFQAITRLENFCSPREFVMAADDIMSGDNEDLLNALVASEAYLALQSEMNLSPLTVEFETRGARLYSRPGRRGKRLLIGFTGRAFRLMLPLAMFQQALPDDTDVMVLFDSLNDHYRREIFDGTGTLFDLPRRMAAITENYTAVIALGTSGGALPSLRFARLARLPRGISIGGRVINDTLRILNGSPLASAYDPLCACPRATTGQSVLVFGDQHPADARTAHIVAACGAADLIPVKGSAEHNLLWPIYKTGRLAAFLDLFLDTNSTPRALRQFFLGL